MNLFETDELQIYFKFTEVNISSKDIPEKCRLISKIFSNETPTDFLKPDLSNFKQVHDWQYIHAEKNRT